MKAKQTDARTGEKTVEQHTGRDGSDVYAFWRCVRCGLESADPRLREGCWRCEAREAEDARREIEAEARLEARAERTRRRAVGLMAAVPETTDTGAAADLDGIAALNARDVRALTEYLFVLEDAPGICLVYGETGREYVVDGDDYVRFASIRSS